MDELSGKVAVVTGASRGIGAAVAREFARRNVAVALCARGKAEIEQLAEELRQAGGKALAIACDVSVYADIAEAVARARSQFGRLDILVNNAGLIEPIAHLADSDPEQWARVADVNYKGVYFGMRAAIPVMERQQTGVIVNISSGAATSPLEGWSHYCSSKAAALMLTHCADKEYRERGIRVVGLSPGTVATGMQTAIRASGINPVSQLDPSVHIAPEWVARAVAWLCTSAAADLAGTDFSLKDEAGRKRAGLG
jgi:3-oxoacyl-[acyl-carrier protein] reductase